MSEQARTRKQPSRKGKKAWRKNVDLNDIEAKLQEVRDEEIVKGPSAQDDFVIDETPNFTSKEYKTPKKLKTQEILTNKSKVPALVNNRAKKNATIQGVKKTEMLRLLKLRGGKYKDESITMARIEQDGLVSGDSEDLWDDDSSTTTKHKQKSLIMALPQPRSLQLRSYRQLCVSSPYKSPKMI